MTSTRSTLLPPKLLVTREVSLTIHNMSRNIDARDSVVCCLRIFVCSRPQKDHMGVPRENSAGEFSYVRLKTAQGKQCLVNGKKKCSIKGKPSTLV